MGQLGDLSPQGSIVLGVFVGLASTSIQSLGLTLQRKSHILEDEKEPDAHRRPPFRRRRWQLGMLIFILSNVVGSSIQITTLPLPVLSTLQASGLVFNSICATLILGEPFTRYSLSGTILVCAGAVLIATFGAIGEPAHNLDQLLQLLGRRQFIIWMLGQAILVIAVIIAARAIKLMNPWTSNNPRTRLVRGMAYGCISGILSAHSLLVAKSAVELLVRTVVDRHNEFNRWQSWMIILAFLALALSQLYYLHRGLKLCSTSILYPFVFCVYNIIAILDGLIYFHQTDRLSVLHALLIALGTVILLAGVLALSWRLSNDTSTRPPFPQPPLTPGMDFVDDSDSNPPTPASNSYEEAGLTPPTHKRTTSLNGSYSQHTPTSNRKPAITESDEIWEDLEDDAVSPLPPFQPRRSSARSTPSSRDTNNPRTPSAGTISEGPPNESTSLLGRTGTGRSYRDKRRRRSSAPRLDLGGGGSNMQARRRMSPQRVQQEATGGWWKMKWWKGKRRKRDDYDGGGRERE